MDGGAGGEYYSHPSVDTKRYPLAYDTAALVPRSLSHVGSNILAGFRGDPGKNDFNAIPATQSAIQYVIDSGKTPARKDAGASPSNPANPLAAAPGSKIVAVGAGGAPITEADVANIKATHERMAAYAAAQKAKGGDTIEEANKKLWTQSADFFGKNGVKGFEKYQSRPGRQEVADQQQRPARTALAQPPANRGGQVMDVHNGNRVDRVTTGGGGIQRISHGSPTLTGDPKKDAINIAAFNAEVNTWNSLNNPKENGLIESRNAVKTDHYPEQAQLERDKMNREDQRESRKDQKQHGCCCSWDGRQD